MEESILNTIKKMLGIDPEYNAFDTDVLVHINSVFSTLADLGIGPVDGFEIQDSASVWIEFTESKARLNYLKTYIYIRVRLLFDPPTNSFTISALEEKAKELEWRLSIHPEGEAWQSPLSSTTT